jgi:type I restriction-modification system DNA methylase subunit
MAKNKSVEEQVEDKAKTRLNKYKLKTYTKTQSINSEIDAAMKKAPSKRGGSGGNYPDIRLLLSTKSKKKYPIIIEVKGTKGKLVKLNTHGDVENFTEKGERNYSNINGFAVNGAVHYANAILDFTKSYKEVIAIGINGYQEADNTLNIEIGVYYVSAKNLGVAKKVDDFSDLSFLAPFNFDTFIGEVEQLKLSPEELDAHSHNIEVRMETGLKNLNQSMHDDLRISVGDRVPLIAGMIMAGLGVPHKVAPLDVPDLKGETGENNNDGNVIINKIRDFLSERDLPREKKNMIVTDLKGIFLNSDLYTPKNEESKLKTVYTRVRAEILPIFTMPKHHLDFTGKLFNVLNEWVDIPDGERNDVVLTPRYVTKMMAQLAKVDKDSFVWDYAAGSAGFLISSMKLMIEDAENKIKSQEKLKQKKSEIKFKQLLGIEKRLDIYLLAVLNMILMEDGSTNILHKDSLTEYNGMYEQGDEKGKPFPANVFLLNPPYSTEGKGFIFARKALERMSSGRAVILIQENAGSGNGLPYTRNILQKNTLLASIHMADIFRGKSVVQTAVYVFEVGKAHDKKQVVKFIDMSNDGYSRQNRKKSGLDVNLRNTDNANERYQEVVNLVNYGKKYLKYFTEEEYIEDTITLDGNDWTFLQHKKSNPIPTEADYMKVVSDYLAWEVGQVLKGEYNA